MCERTTKFHEKILFDNGVIDLQIPMTKYIGFHCSLQSGGDLSGSDVVLTQST